MSVLLRRSAKICEAVSCLAHLVLNNTPATCASTAASYWTVVMKLGDHLSMSYHGQRSWPPLWTRISGASAIMPLIGEFGILINVRCSVVADDRCFLTMEYLGTTYITCLWLDDPQFCRGLVDLLQEHIGEPITCTSERCNYDQQSFCTGQFRDAQ